MTKLNTLSQYDPATMLFSIYPKDMKTYVHTENPAYEWNCQNLEASIKYKVCCLFTYMLFVDCFMKLNKFSSLFAKVWGFW